MVQRSTKTEAKFTTNPSQSKSPAVINRASTSSHEDQALFIREDVTKPLLITL